MNFKVEHISAKEFNAKYGSIFKEPKKGNKFNAKKTMIGEKKFDSVSEGDYYCQLEIQVKAGLIQGFDTQVKEELWAYGVHICDYYVDFLVYHNDGSKEYIEHKSPGTITSAWRIKYKLLQAKYLEDKNVKVSTNWYKGYRTIKR